MNKKSRILRKILIASMAFAMVTGAGISTSVGSFIGTNTVVSAVETYGEFEYAINNDNTIRITGYYGGDDHVDIPSEIDGKSVKSIGYRVFYGCTGLTSVTIPDSVTLIENSAFRGCTDLTSIVITDSVTSIESSAFYGCTGLTSVTIPDSITSMGSNVFCNCTGLTSITIPDSVISIGASAFEGCTGLTNITIPDSVKSIGNSAFRGCTELTSIDVESDNNVYSSQDGVLLDKDKTNVIECPVGKQGGYTIPDSVTSIGNSAFRGCTGLTSITIPDSVVSVKDSAFYDCTGLTSIIIPDSVESIGYDAFENCTGLTSIKLPHRMKYISGFAFKNCTGLTSIVIPDGLTSIDSHIFYGCTGLTSVTIPDSATLIDEYAFGGCTGLTSIKFPGKVESIGRYAFYGCTGLTSITIPDNVSVLGGAFCGCTGLTSVTIPYNVSMWDNVFYGCTGLTSVTITDGVDSIPNSTFYGCKGLTSITLPDSITSINGYAFGGCTGLTSIIIPDSVESIGYDAFYNCANLTLYGHQGSYAETYANENNIPFVSALYNHSSVSAEEINPGESVTVNANASGGNGDYTYAVLYKKTTDSKWIIKQNYKANANISIKPETSGTYDICVKVKDGNGNIEKKYFTVKVLGELENNSELSATEITLGDTITATAQGEGGTGEYTYAVLYKKKSDTKWTVKQYYKENDTVTIKPAHSVEYDVCIKVKDGDGNIAKKYFTVNVKKLALANGSAVSSSSITLGNTVTVKATATGGTTPYTYAVYTKKSTTSKWTENQAYSTNSSVNFKPTAKGTYDICVKVKDKAGTVEKKYLTVTVK